MSTLAFRRLRGTILLSLLALVSASCGGGGGGGGGGGSGSVPAPPPALTDVSPGWVVQGEADVTLTLTGENFLSGGSVSFGEGVTVTSTNLVSPTELEAIVETALDAELGPHDVTYRHPPSAGGVDAKLEDGLEVRAPTPTVASISPSTVTQGETGVTVTLTGTGFRDGATVSFGDGISVTGTNFVSPTSFQATVDVDPLDATPGPHDVVFTQPAVGGGSEGVLVGGLQVDAPVPIVQSISPSTLTQGASSVRITLTGQDFRPGGGVSFGTGITVTDNNFVSPTTFEATVDAHLTNATLGAHDVVYAQLNEGGGAIGRLAGGLQVDAPTPTLASISPTSLAQGATGTVITLTGTNFRSGCTVSFGTGITVTGTNVVSATSIKATVSAGLTTATLGTHNVVYTHPSSGGGAGVTLSNGLQVNAPTPTVASISPSRITQGATGTVITLTGTNFRAGGSVSFGTGITVTGTNLVSATSLKATVSAGLTTATLGTHDVVYTHPAAGGGGTGTLSNGLQVDAPTPTVTSISPTSLTQGASGTVITLTGTNFRAGGTVSFGTGITVTTVNVVSATSCRATVSADLTAATLGTHDVVYTHPASGGGASATLTKGLQVNAPSPTVTSISPASVTQGASGAVIALTGTNFRTGGSVSFGTGITVTSLTVVSATSCRATVNVGLTTATLGKHSVVYSQPTGAGGAGSTLTNGLQVNAPTPTVTSISPSSIVQGASGVTITLTGTNFRSGGTVSFGTGITVTSTSVVSATSVQATVNAHLTNATLGTHDVVYTHPAAGGGATGTLTNGLQVNAPVPTVTAVSPSSVTQGASGVVITLTGTNFRSGGTVSFGTGITVTSTSLVSATSVKATVNAHLTNATLGKHDVVYTHPTAGGGGNGTLTNGLQVNAPTPTITSVSPSTVTQGASATVITLTGTNFRSGGTASFGTGITVTSTTVTATSFQATVNVGLTTATLGKHDVVYTHPAAGGGASVTLANGLQVNSPAPTVTSISPSSITQGASGVTITLTGTNFRSGGTVSFGTGITVTSSTYVSATSLTATINAGLTSATPGKHDVVYTAPASAGSATGTLTGGLQVNAPTPTVTSISPATITQGTTGTVITLTGTNFRSGGTVSFGTGVSVTATNFVSATSIKATVSAHITNATLGKHDVVYTHPAAGGGASVTLSNGLQVNAPAPTVTSISPSSIVQGASGVTITLTGTNFRSGGTVSFGTGITVTSSTYVGATSLTATINAHLTNATLGTHDVVYTHPAAGGGATGTLTNGLQVNAPVPTVTAISPSAVTQGASGVVITLTGTNFRSGGTVSFGTGITVTATNLVSATSIQATVNVHLVNATLGKHDVVYTHPTAGGGGTGTLTNGLQVNAPAPTVTSVSPTSVTQGASGTVITLTGTNFRSGGTASFGTGITVTSTTVTATSFQATVNVGLTTATLGKHDVVYTHPAAGGGASVTLSNGLQVNAPTPTVTSINPNSIAQGASGVTITLTGTSFRSGGTVSFGTGITVTSSTYVGATSLTATINAHLTNATLGTHDVVYTHPAAGGGATGTLTNGLQVNAPVPTVTAISPTSVTQGASGVVITLTGTNFRSGGTVSFGTGITVTATNLVSATSIQATVNVHLVNATLGKHDVVYTHPTAGGGGTGTLTNGLQVNAPTPTITSVSPSTVAQGASAVVITLTGTNFRSGGAVYFGTGIAVTSASVVSATSLQATVNVGLTSATLGSHDVVYTHPTAGGGANATLSGGLQVNAPTPTISSISPATMTQGDTGTTITLTGTNFRSGGTVSFGTGITVTSSTYVGATSLTATINAHLTNATLGTHDVVYTHPAAGGGATGTLTNGLQVNAPVPTVTAISPSSVTQGASGVTITLTGTNFRSGGTASFGTGITVTSTTVTATSFAATVNVGLTTATLGKHDVVYTHPAAGGGASVTLSNGLQVNAPTPTITSISPTSAKPGMSGVAITLTGTNFRSGGTVSFGAGVTVTANTYVSTTSFRATISVSSSATLGSRTVTYTQPTVGGGATATLTNGLLLFAAPPTLSSVTASAWFPGNTREIARLTGSNYNTGTTVSVSGTGVTIHSTTFVSSTSLRVEYSVASNATLGARNLTITPGTGGGVATTFNSVVTISPADPVVTSFSRLTLTANSAVSVTIRGTNFRTSDTVAASGTGVTFASVSVTNSTTITATVSVSSSAATGTRSVTVTHSSSEGGRSGTLTGAFTIVSGNPTVTSIVPSVVGRTGTGGPTRRVPVTVKGTGFASGASLTLGKTGGTGLSVVTGSATVVDSGTLTATLSVTPSASTGTWNLTVTNPNTTKGTGNNLLTINGSTTLAVNNVVPPSGSSTGGERVTVYGSGFATGAVVDFGTVRGTDTVVVDGNTLITTVPPPASLSSSAQTVVSVKVTNTSGTPSNVTLSNAYAYAADAANPTIVGTIPTNTSSTVPKNQLTWIFVLSEDVKPSTANSTTGFAWFGTPTNDISNPNVSSVGIGSGRRLVAVHRNTSPGTLGAGSYRVNIPTTVTDLAGNALDPTPFSGTIFQASFSVSTSSDTTAPTVSSITPAGSATGVATGTNIKIVFSEPVDPTTVTSTTVTVKQGTAVIGAAYSLGTDAKTLLIVPNARLAAGKTYTTNVTAGVKDLCGNTFSNQSWSFTTGSSDGTAPTIDAVVIEGLRSDMDGSGTYVNQSGTATAFDLYLPRHGWLVEVEYSDTGSGIAETTFSAKANVAVAGNSSGAELASNFTVSSTRAYWRIPSAGFATGDNATLTFTIKDQSSNSATNHTVTFDIASLSSTAVGHWGSGGRTGGDLDPFGSRQTWVLRSDLDAYTATFSTPSSQQGVTTTVASNNVLDLDEALRLTGLNTASMSTNSASCVNGREVGTNAIVRRLLMERIRALVRAHYGIAEDGTRGPDSINIEFLLQGETGSLSSFPTYSTSNTSSSSAGFSEMSIGGTKGADSQAVGTGYTLGTAWQDGRNTRQEANLNDGSSSNTGVYLMAMLKNQVNSSTSLPFGGRVSAKFVTVHGGTPVGTGSLDHIVLAGTFVRSSGTAAQKTRYDDIMDAIELTALYAASTVAHEIAHSTGLVLNKVVSGTPGDGAPKTGLFGYAHYNNPFTEATSATPNTSWHLNYLGNDLMTAAKTVVQSTATGTNRPFFNPFNRAYLLRRLIYDEGK